jgi:hypothetical protein
MSITFFSDNDQKQICTRTNKVYGLYETTGTNNTEGTDAFWKELPDQALSKPRSSHVLLTVPRTFAPKCKLILP